jgi:hypothetical protein
MSVSLTASRRLSAPPPRPAPRGGGGPPAAAPPVEREVGLAAHVGLDEDHPVALRGPVAGEVARDERLALAHAGAGHGDRAGARLHDGQRGGQGLQVLGASALGALAATAHDRAERREPEALADVDGGAQAELQRAQEEGHGDAEDQPAEQAEHPGQGDVGRALGRLARGREEPDEGRVRVLGQGALEELGDRGALELEARELPLQVGLLRRGEARVAELELRHRDLRRELLELLAQAGRPVRVELRVLLARVGDEGGREGVGRLLGDLGAGRRRRDRDERAGGDRRGLEVHAARDLGLLGDDRLERVVVQLVDVAPRDDRGLVGGEALVGAGGGAHDDRGLGRVVGARRRGDRDRRHRGDDDEEQHQPLPAADAVDLLL